MRQVLPILLALLVLFQSTSRTWVLLDYQLNQSLITEFFCVNKTKPELACHGKCYLKKELQKTQDTENKAKKNLQLSFDYLLPKAALVLTKQPSLLAESVGVSSDNLYSLLTTKGFFHPPCC